MALSRVPLSKEAGADVKDLLAANPDTASVIPHMTMAATRHLERALTGLDFCIDASWDGQPVDHEPYTIHLEWFFERQKNKAHKRVVKVSIDGPLMDDPEPPSDAAGICANLWEYEAVELFFANDKEQYLEVEVGPHGHWLVYLLNGRRKPFNKGEELELRVENTFEGNMWRSNVEIPLAYFPPNVRKFNAFAVHGSEPHRHHEALYPVTDGSFDTPDFHRLQFFKPIDIKRVIPESFTDHAFDDMQYGNMWEGVLYDK